MRCGCNASSCHRAIHRPFDSCRLAPRHLLLVPSCFPLQYSRWELFFSLPEQSPCSSPSCPYREPLEASLSSRLGPGRVGAMLIPGCTTTSSTTSTRPRSCQVHVNNFLSALKSFQTVSFAGGCLVRAVLSWVLEVTLFVCLALLQVEYHYGEPVDPTEYQNEYIGQVCRGFAMLLNAHSPQPCARHVVGFSM